MSIRIRIYPQPGSVGMRRKRAARVQQQRIQIQQFQLQRQQELLRQQQLRMSMYAGAGAWASPFGSSFGAYSSGLGFAYPSMATSYSTPWATPMFGATAYGSPSSVWYGSTGLYDAGFGAYGC